MTNVNLVTAAVGAVAIMTPLVPIIKRGWKKIRRGKLVIVLNDTTFAAEIVREQPKVQ